MEEEEMGCQLAVAARNGVGAVSRCAGCGCVHLMLTHVTLRLAPEAFGELVGLVVLAHRRLAGRPAAEDPAVPAAAPGFAH